MKSYLFVILTAILVFSFAGCKKKSFDPTSKSQADFIGTWKGTISTFKNNKLMKEYGTVVIYPAVTGNILTGVMFIGGTSVFHEFQFVNGTLYFNVENNDPANPFCQNWNLGGYAVFTSEDEMDISITGNECGQVGNEFVNWEGTIRSATLPPDSIKYYCFANSGNIWNYTVTLKNGESCMVTKQTPQPGLNYNFFGTIVQNCGWTGQAMTFMWTVTPAVFAIQKDSTISLNPVAFPINAKPGVVYSSYLNTDTITVTLVDTNLNLNTPAGNFMCMKYQYTEPVYSGALKIKKIAYLWVNTRYGVIRQEVSNPVDSTDVRVQELLSKTF